MSGELRGFGMVFDCERGGVRNWYMGKDGVRRWADSDEPVDDESRYTITEKGKAMLRDKA